MKLNFTLWFSVLMLFVALSSCEDHRIPQGQRFRVKRISSFGLRSYASTVFNYSPDGRIASYVDYTSSGRTDIPGHTVTLNYNQQGQLISAYGESVDNYPIRYTYDYDAKGNIVSVKYYNDRTNSGNYVLATDYKLEYSTTKFPDKVTSTSLLDIPTTTPFSLVEQYTYSNGNIIQIQSSNLPAIQTYTYTNSLNPFYGLVYRVPDASIYTKNVSNDPSVVYTYNSNGLLVKSYRSAGPFASQNDYTQTFEYEAY